MTGMAVKRSSKVTKQPSVKEADFLPGNTPSWSPTPAAVSSPKKKIQAWKWIALIIAVVGFWWYRTNTWPVVAVVGFRPIFRHQVNQALYKQGGKAVVDSLVTEKLVKSELDRLGVRVTDQEVDTKMEEIIKSLGEGVNFEELLAERGLNMDEVRKQVQIQTGIEKALADKATFSAQEMEDFLNENGSFISGTSSAEKQVNAEKALKQQKLQEEVSKWIEGLKASAKIWYVGMADSK